MGAEPPPRFLPAHVVHRLPCVNDIAGITTVVAFFSGLAILVDAVLFALIGFGVRKMWRSAAVAGFVLYIVEQSTAMAQGRVPGVLIILIPAILSNSIRASFSFRRMRRQISLLLCRRLDCPVIFPFVIA